MPRSNKPSLAAMVRMNHGLEHATINVLERRFPGMRLAGYSTPFGFLIMGGVSLELLLEGIREAKARITEGNRSLVIHDRCGTNLATGGVLSALAAWIALFGIKRGVRAHLERLPLAILLTMVALYFSPHVGMRIQQKLTTTSELLNLEVESISKTSWGKQTRYFVKTRYAQSND